MKTRMTHAARAELANAVRSRYTTATGSAKRKILDEFIAASGYHEKSAIRVLNATRTARERQTDSGRRSTMRPPGLRSLCSGRRPIGYAVSA